MGLKRLIKQVLTEKNNIRYERILETRRMSYGDWITQREKTSQVCGETEDEQPPLYLIFHNPAGRTSEDAEKWVQRWFEEFPDALILYGDEDVWEDGGERENPCFKPDWSPDLLDAKFYLGNLVALRKSWFQRHVEGSWEYDGDLSGASEEDQIAAYHRFVRHCVRLAGGYEKGLGRKTILHVPRILFHCESGDVRERWMRYGAAGQNPAEQTCPREEVSQRLSVVIPSKDNPDLLEKCIRGLISTTHGMPYEIVVVDNGSAPQNKAIIEEKLKTLQQSGTSDLTQILYHYEPAPFHFSKMCNLGAEKASGELLLFLNDDVELVADGTIRAMAEMASRPYTGAVGLKLLYPGGESGGRIQHAGITNLPMGPVHKLQFCPDGEEAYLGWNRGRRNVLAVTAACLMMEREKFREVGGFAEELAVAFNDVDLCYHLYERGYENVCECDFFAYHHESYSRGDDASPEKLERLLAERAKLYERHPGLDAAVQTKGTDPYYPVFLNREFLDTCIRPAYETAGNKVQSVAPGQLRTVTERELNGLREDPCLMTCVESVFETPGDAGMLITGWGVVLGDNNACYDRYLVLRGEQCHVILLQEQYRPDLTENMPDQEKVGLCGYQVLLEKNTLPPGRYRLGMAAISRINGVKLLNWSNRVLQSTGGE